MAISVTLYCERRGVRGKGRAKGSKERNREGKGWGYRIGRELLLNTHNSTIETLIRVRKASGQVRSNAPDHPPIGQMKHVHVKDSLGGPQKCVKIPIPHPPPSESSDPLRMAPLPPLLTTTANVLAASSAMPRGTLNLAFVATPFVDPGDPAPARVDNTPEDRTMCRMRLFTWSACIAEGRGRGGRGEGERERGGDTGWIETPVQHTLTHLSASEKPRDKCV